MGRLSDVEVIDEDGNYHVPDPELIKLGEQILDLFIELKPNYMPGRAFVGKKFYKDFYRAAELCIEEGLTPEAFVYDRLKRMAILGKFWPNLIASTALPKLEDDHNILWVRNFYHYKQQLDVYARMSMIYGPRAVLEDETIQLTPLFRALMAKEQGYEDIVAEHKAAALLELKSNETAQSLFAELAESLNARE